MEKKKKSFFAFNFFIYNLLSFLLTFLLSITAVKISSPIATAVIGIADAAISFAIGRWLMKNCKSAVGDILSVCFLALFVSIFVIIIVARSMTENILLAFLMIAPDSIVELIDPMTGVSVDGGYNVGILFPFVLTALGSVAAAVGLIIKRKAVLKKSNEK